MVALQVTACAGLRAATSPQLTARQKAMATNARTLVQRGVVSLTDSLKVEEASIFKRQTDIREAILYLDKVRTTALKEEGLLRGKMDQADQKMTQKMLLLLKDETFTKKLDAAFKDLELVVKHIPALSHKRVQEAISKPHDTADQRFMIANQFFRRELSLVGTQITRFTDIVRGVVESMPEDYTVYRRLALLMLEDLTEDSKNVTSKFLASEEIFCEHVRPQIEDRVMPVVKVFLNFLPRMQDYTDVHLPEASPVAAKVISKMTSLTNSFVNLFQKEILQVVNKVCPVISTASAPATTPPAESAASPPSAEPEATASISDETS